MNWKKSVKNVIQELSHSSQVGAHCNVFVVLCQFYNMYLTSQSCITPITGCLIVVYQDHTRIISTPMSGPHPPCHQDHTLCSTTTTPSALPGPHPPCHQDHTLCSTKTTPSVLPRPHPLLYRNHTLCSTKAILSVHIHIERDTDTCICICIVYYALSPYGENNNL